MGRKQRLLGGLGVIVGLVLIFMPFLSAGAQSPNIVSSQIEANLLSYQPLSTLGAEAPTIAKPDWYFKTTVYYTVAKNGSVSDIDEFATLADQTLNDARGWARLGVRFEKVTSGGTLHFVLAQASALPSYSSGCTSDWSCTVGDTVIINDNRWAAASDSWNAAGGSLRDYRNMVINHETGHWLGHAHEFCSAAGALAPVMQQQSIDLMGCKFNPWPLDSELWSSRLGI